MTDATPDRPGSAASPERLVAQAAQTSGLLWIDVPGDRPWPAWHVWVEGAIFVLSGPGEQTLPDLPAQVELILRSKASGGRLIRMAARTHRVEATDPQWDVVTAALKDGRLNRPPEDAEVTIQRWAEHNTVTALVPMGEPLEQPGDYRDDSGAAPPASTPATTATWRPRHLGGRPRRRRR